MSDNSGIKAQELIDILQFMLSIGVIDQATPVIFPDMLNLVHISVDQIGGCSFLILSDMYPEGHNESDSMPHLH
jgi:hypothetical protein